MVSVCCINVADYCGRGADYANKLHRSVRRHLSPGFLDRFICFTDNVRGLDDGIEPRPLPVSGLEGWWNKLALFKPGVFPDGERALFFDLDTLIVGGLDTIARYDGDFALLRDFYYPQHGGPGVIAWSAGGDRGSIWSEWDSQGRPLTGLGDLWWINALDQGRFAHRADKFQDLYPGRFLSYKVHCIPRRPEDAAVICFHGQPKNHNCGGWAQQMWDAL